MSVINALFSAAFLILVAVSAAVTGSIVLLALFDWAFRKERRPEHGVEGKPDDRNEDLDHGNENEADDALESGHAEQMRKFGARRSAL